MDSTLELKPAAPRGPHGQVHVRGVVIPPQSRSGPEIEIGAQKNRAECSKPRPPGPVRASAPPPGRPPQPPHGPPGSRLPPPIRAPGRGAPPCPKVTTLAPLNRCRGPLARIPAPPPRQNAGLRPPPSPPKVTMPTPPPQAASPTPSERTANTVCAEIAPISMIPHHIAVFLRGERPKRSPGQPGCLFFFFLHRSLGVGQDLFGY